MKRLVLALSLLAAFTSACSHTEEGPAEGDRSFAALTADSERCVEVCDHLGELCGPVPSECRTVCIESFTAQARGCVVEANDCDAARSCTEDRRLARANDDSAPGS